MDARNSQFLQRTATNSSGSLQLKSPVSLEAGDFSLYTLAPLGLALLVLMGLLGGCLPRRCLPRRVSCDCPGTAWYSERLALALAPVCLAELWREFPLAGACLGGCPALVLALLGLASALRLPWHLSAWRSCEVLACDSDLVRQGRGLPYKTGSVKDWFGKTRFSRTNWIRRRISLAQ